jgi:hypothetical protein
MIVLIIISAIKVNNRTTKEILKKTDENKD